MTGCLKFHQNIPAVHISYKFCNWIQLIKVYKAQMNEGLEHETNNLRRAIEECEKMLHTNPTNNNEWMDLD